MHPNSTSVPRHQRDTDSLDIARDHFAALVTGPHPLTINGRQFSGLPHRHLPLDELRDLLLTRRCPQATSDAVWTHLVQHARTKDSTWALAAIGVAMPALTSAAATLSRQMPEDPGVAQAEVLTGFLEALATINVARPRIMLRLRWAAYRAGHTLVRKAQEHRPCTVHEVPARPIDRPADHPDIVLARAVADGVLTATDADLIGTTRLESVRITQWAADHHVTDWAAYKSRRRAELRLAAYLRTSMTEATDEMTDGIATTLALQQRTRNTETSHRSAPTVSKTGPEIGLKSGKEFPSTTASPEVRPCA